MPNFFRQGESSLVETPFWCASLFVGTFASLDLSPQFFALTLRSYPYSRIEPQCLVEESYQHASAWPGFPSVPAVPLL